MGELQSSSKTKQKFMELRDLCKHLRDITLTRATLKNVAKNIPNVWNIFPGTFYSLCKVALSAFPGAQLAGEIEYSGRPGQQSLRSNKMAGKMNSLNQGN
jgi:hypothetical protein